MRARQKDNEGKAKLEEKEKFLISFLIQNKERAMREEAKGKISSI